MSPCIEAREEVREVWTSPSVDFNSVNSTVTCKCNVFGDFLFFDIDRDDAFSHMAVDP